MALSFFESLAKLDFVEHYCIPKRSLQESRRKVKMMNVDTFQQAVFFQLLRISERFRSIMVKAWFLVE